MFKETLSQLVAKKNSLLCIGLDSEIDRLPPSLLSTEDPLYIFNQKIIEATRDIAVAYKFNIAFYESLGIPGWELLKKTLDLIDRNVLVIADAKRGDIGNSSRKYAETFFNVFNFHAVTVSPYMGYDSVLPFLEYHDKCIFVLCLTSNEGALDFQYLNVGEEPLFLKVARKVNEWNLQYGNCGLVVGATHPEDILSVREAAPTLPFLIPGIGFQGGNLYYSVRYGTDAQQEMALIHSSRTIIYASSGEDFAERAREEAIRLRDEINRIRQEGKREY